MTLRRFPAPCAVEEQPACFVAKDHAGQKLAYVYFEEEPGRRSAAKLLTKDEARRIAAKFARLPELLHPIPAIQILSIVREARQATGRHMTKEGSP
jgi:hypothetical protein